MATYQLNVSFSQLVSLVQTLPQNEKKKLVRILQQEEEPSTTTEEILSNLKADYIALQKGTLKTRPVEELFEELKNEGYL